MGKRRWPNVAIFFINQLSITLMSIFAHKAMFIVDIGNETYTLHFTETYMLYFIPHQRPSIIGTVHVKPSGETFRFSADQIADETIVEVFGNGNVNDGRSPTVPDDTIKHCIKVYYHQLLRERNR